jgi:hypothetical protein
MSSRRPNPDRLLMIVAAMVVLPAPGAPGQNRAQFSSGPVAQALKLVFSRNHSPVFVCLRPKLSDCCAVKSIVEIKSRVLRRARSSSAWFVALSMASLIALISSILLSIFWFVAYVIAITSHVHSQRS